MNSAAYRDRESEADFISVLVHVFFMFLGKRRRGDGQTGERTTTVE